MDKKIRRSVWQTNNIVHYFYAFNKKSSDRIKLISENNHMNLKLILEASRCFKKNLWLEPHLNFYVNGDILTKNWNTIWLDRICISVIQESVSRIRGETC